MNFRTKIIITTVLIVLMVLIFSLFFINLFVRQYFVQIFVGGPPGKGMAVVIPEPGLKFLRTVRFTLLISAGISLIIAILVSIFISDIILNPLKKMSSFARKISTGDYSARVEVKTNDEIGKLAESLNYMAYRLYDIEQMRKTLIQNVSHDLRTPLSCIKGYLELLSDSQVTETEKKESINIIGNEVSRMEKMVNDLTKLSILDGKNFELNKVKLDLVDSAKNVVSSMKFGAQAKGLEVIENYPERPVHISGDEKRIEEVILNLLNNSLKFTMKGFISVKVKEEKDSVVLEISDTGPGIEEKDLPHVFERFYRGEKSRANDDGGLGIGLSIVKELVYAHNGTIKVESKVNEGTKFTLAFPAYKEIKSQ